MSEWLCSEAQAMPRLLCETDLHDASATLGVPVACIQAVNEVESRGRGFLRDGRPVILFERHIFWQRLAVHGIEPLPLAVRQPEIVSLKPGGYLGGRAEYNRLAAAAKLCQPAAYESASWGAFQIMGYHWQRLGYASIDAFVAAQRHSEAEQLAAFVAFIHTDPTLHRALKARQWARFARGYNGPAYAQNRYDLKLAQAYERYAGQTAEALT